MANTRVATTNIKTKNPTNINSRAAIGVVLTIAKGIPISIVILPFFSSEFKLPITLSEQWTIYQLTLIWIDIDLARWVSKQDLTEPFFFDLPTDTVFDLPASPEANHHFLHRC